MSYNLTFEKKNDVLWVTATGVRSLESVLAIGREILAALVDNHVTKVLIDVRALAGRLGTMESYEIVDQRFPEWRDHRVVTRCSIVDLKDFEQSYRYFENLAVNRGFALRIFAETDEAFRWLSVDPT